MTTEEIIKKVRRVSPGDILNALRISGILLILPYLQRRRSLPDLLAFFDTPGDGQTCQDNIHRVAHIAELILRSAYGTDYCLQKSLILFHFLRRSGRSVQLHFGVTRLDGDLRGHAWVELDGKPFVEYSDPHVTYKTAFLFPGA